MLLHSRRSRDLRPARQQNPRARGRKSRQGFSVAGIARGQDRSDRSSAFCSLWQLSSPPAAGACIGGLAGLMMICLLVCFKRTLIGPARVLSSSPRCFSRSPAGYFGASGPCQAPRSPCGNLPLFPGAIVLGVFVRQRPGEHVPPNLVLPLAVPTRLKSRKSSKNRHGI